VHPRSLPSAEIDLDLPGGAKEQWKWRRGLGLGSKPRRLIPCRKVGCMYTLVDVLQ
jgi:hypothetical protein